MNKMNKSVGIGLLKTIMKKNYINKHQTMEINHSNRYSPSKKQKRQIISINKASKGDLNSNLEKKKIIYQQSLQKLDKTNKLKLSQNKKNMEINQYYKNNNILNGNNIPNNFKNRLNNSKTINNLKNKNYNTSLQKKIGSKSYVDLFQNNIYNSNDHIIPGGGKTISNSIYEKIYDIENENINFINNMNNNENNSTNEYNNTFVEETNNIINVLFNYIAIIRQEYEKLFIQTMQNKDKEISKLKKENEFLIKENKDLKYKILEIFYCTKKYYTDKENNESKTKLSIKHLLEENLFLRKCLNNTSNINKDYLIKLENDIMQQFKYKELLNQKKILEEEKNNETNKDDIIIIKEENKIKINDDDNSFKFINENNANNSNNNKINHKRQKTQFKLNYPENDGNKSENIEQIDEKENNNDNNDNNSDSLSNYLKDMSNNKLMSRTKNSSQKNLLMNKNNSVNSDIKKINKDSNSTISENNNNYNSQSEQSFDSIIHNKDNKNNMNENEMNKEKENLDKKLSGMNSNFSFDKYSQRIEFTK